MLQDSDVNVYQQQKVKLREEGFTIRGKKQRTQAQKEQLIRERKHQEGVPHACRGNANAGGGRELPPPACSWPVSTGATRRRSWARRRSRRWLR